MPRYFFHLAGSLNDPDSDGVVLKNLSMARIEAARFAGAYLVERPEVVWSGAEFRIEVSDKDQRTLFTFIALGVDSPKGRRKKSS